MKRKISIARSLFHFGTYGFLSTLLAAQMAFADTAAEKMDDVQLQTKKAARAAKNDVKKGARKVTGQDNKWDDLKDDASEVKENIKDEARHHTKKLKR